MKNDKNGIVFEAKEDSGLLDCVRRELAHLPGGRVKSFLEHRLISVDGLVTSKYDYPVKRGQTIRIRQAGESAYHSPLEILYEDDSLIAVNKPAGLLTVSTDTEKDRTAYRLLKDSGSGAVFVVHRLDRDTSGVLLFAKSTAIRDELQHNWDDTRRREYHAICEGVFTEKSGRRETLLRETLAHMVYSAPYGDGRRAVTEYEVMKENAKYSYLRVLIETGRKNQIRVHMKELGHPVVGDKKYGASGNPLKRLGLHAVCLEIIHPVTGEPLTIRAEPDPGFRLPRAK
ncbi:MAG: RluA family pseudouridine synthase [Clostridia bacterium]|nr:RluA family pseudouridine synthase [Clostridia bacterium]